MGAKGERSRLPVKEVCRGRIGEGEEDDPARDGGG